MPCDYSKYPADWKAISATVKEQAGDCCQTCGVANHAVIFRSIDGAVWYDPEQDCYFRWPNGQQVEGRFEAQCREKATKVVLTVAHTAENGADPHDKHDLRGLKALCQACHLALDLPDHIAHRKSNRHAKNAVSALPGLEF